MTIKHVPQAAVVRPGRFLWALLIGHGVATLAAAVVLAVLPAAIPALVGIPISPPQYLLAYLLAAAELAIAVLSIGAVLLTDRAALTLIIGAFIAFHLATAALEVLYTNLTPITPVLVANILVRVVAAALFFAAAGALPPAPARLH